MFEFGKNWKNFIRDIEDEQVLLAEQSLKDWIPQEEFHDRTFLDVGSGSGLFSLIAHRLGAHVHSFDYDPESVECTASLRDRFAAGSNWIVEHGSILDESYVDGLPRSDIVYSWGVLHHTGDMYQAFQNVAQLPKSGGYLFISIYNDLGDEFTNYWRDIKKQYTEANEERRTDLLKHVLYKQWSNRFTNDFFETGDPLTSWNAYKQEKRGMSPYYDVVDWAGGYPYEVAKPDHVVSVFEQSGFELIRINRKTGSGCNEFLFRNNG